jgi:hypothetical protein
MTPPSVLVYRDVSAEDAVMLNAEMPVSTAPLVSARPFRLAVVDAASQSAATDCMTAALYYEAASEGEGGQRAVAQVILNRLHHPAFPKTVCGVVFQGADRTTGCQFTFACDGSLDRIPSSAGWTRARKIAEQALSGSVDKAVGLSTHYHTVWVVPYWRSDLTKLAVIGAHIFYRWSGSWGGASAFGGHYAMGEVLPLKLAVAVPADYLLSPLPSLAQSGLNQMSLGGGILADRMSGGLAGTARSRLTADSAPVAVPVAGKISHLAADRGGGRLMADDHSGKLAHD